MAAGNPFLVQVGCGFQLNLQTGGELCELRFPGEGRESGAFKLLSFLFGSTLEEGAWSWFNTTGQAVVNIAIKDNGVLQVMPSRPERTHGMCPRGG
jgi:hypothetical protein